MTTYYAYVRPVSGPFVFQPTLDGQQYVVSVWWNVAGQRNFFTVQQLDTTVVLTAGLVGSDVGMPIQSLTWDAGEVSVDTVNPHGYAIGATLDLTVAGASVAAYNGIWRCFVTDPNTLSYDLATNPGASAVNGVLSYDINLVKGYFTTSTLVYRSPNGTFEVSP